MITYIIIYLIGYIIAYYLGRYELRREFKEDYSFQDVIFLLCISLFSWVTILVGIGIILQDTPKFKIKPPKWL